MQCKFGNRLLCDTLNPETRRMDERFFDSIPKAFDITPKS